MAPSPRDLDVDRLPRGLEVRFLEGASFGAATERGPRSPHRHDYHEIVWSRRSTAWHTIDGEPVVTRPGTLTIIGRGRVHRLERAEDVDGAVVRFGEELLHDVSSWLIGTTATHTVDVPAGSVDALDGLLRTLASEAARPPDARSHDLQRHLLGVLLLWIDRWWDDARTDRRDVAHDELERYRRFLAVLERDFAAHHDAVHYADALGVPQAALSKALAHATGRTTKEHITDRRLLEAARLLRFTTLTIGEVAFRAGYPDQLYFSRAFRRRYGQSPTDYRQVRDG